jgi:hypothetical protein
MIPLDRFIARLRERPTHLLTVGVDEDEEEPDAFPTSLTGRVATADVTEAQRRGIPGDHREVTAANRQVAARRAS